MKPDEVVAILGASPREVDLSSFVHDRHQHPDPTPLTVLTWALLSMSTVPEKLILPETLASRRAIARAGVVFAADRRSVSLELEGAAVSSASALRAPRPGVEPQALPGFDWKRFDELLVTDDGEVSDRLTRLRVVVDLEDSARKPSQPDSEQRRYRWIDNTGAAASLSDVDAKTFNADADQVLYEAIDNVHEWSHASAALACCAVTRGGGDDSFNRFHITVVDDGVGILQSIDDRRDNEDLPSWRKDSKVLAMAREAKITVEEALLRLLVHEAHLGRALKPTDQGQGLHAVGVLSRCWSGTFRVLTSNGQTCTWVGRSGVAPGLESGQFDSPGLTGTALHVTLDARVRAGEHAARRRALVSSTAP